MSWVKKRATPSPVSNTTAGVPGVPLYNTNQPAQYQQQWQQNYKNPQSFQQPQSLPPQYSSNNWYNQTHGQGVINNQEQNYNWNQNSQQNVSGGGNYWQPTDQQQSSYNNVIAPGTNANQYPYQTPTPPLLLQSQNQQYYPNAGYHYPQNVRQNQPSQPSSIQQNEFNQNNYTQQQPNSLTNQNNPENDAWNWGWDDESTNNSGNTNENNANQNFSTIQDSFNVQADDTWNWTVEDSNSSSASNSYKTEIGKQLKTEIKQDEPPQSVSFEQMGPLAAKHQGKLIEESKENVVSLEQIPSTFTGRRIKNENTLTSQWSIESQLSQDSSDDMLQTSESNKLSRSSTISQCPSLPNSNQDCEQTYANQEEIKEYKQEPPLPAWNDNNFEPTQISDVTQAINNLTLQHQGLFENKEIVTPETHIAKNVTPPLNPVKIISPPLATPPPPGVSNVEDNVNPYKRTSGKSSYKIRVASNLYSGRSSQENILSSNFIQQQTNLIGEKKSQLEVNQVANLETVPDNVERPDQIPIDLSCQNNTSRKANNQAWPTSSSSGVENLEVAPKNDRNQYLETGQLSDNDVPDVQQNDPEQNTEEPPPGLRRMVLGRTETDSSISSSINPTPRILTGLDRVVDGESENVMNSQSINLNSLPEGNYELPAGLHRMVPGESSSPESNARWSMATPNIYFRSNTSDDDDTEIELQNIEGNIPHRPTQRSETIGADTPPTTQSTDVSLNRNRNVLVSDVRETNVDGADTQSDSVPISSDTSARNSSQNHERIDVQTTLRSQTDGENTTDNNIGKDQSRHTTRTDSSEDDHEIRESSIDRRKNKSPAPRYDKDKKYYDHRDRETSPDRYWDRKSDRRRRGGGGGGNGVSDRDHRFYEEDTDYSSDKERKDRRLKDNRPNRDEYDRIYNSLKRVIEREGGRGGDYDRMISTLRREMDRDGGARGERSKRDRGRERGSEYDGRETRRDDFYYGRYDDEYYGRESRSSRPSSRSDSNYRERLDHRKNRDPYNSYYQGAYDPYYAVHYQQHYQYYENLRRTNPAAYAEWYRKYLQSYGAMGAPTSIEGFRGHEDKASVHSGRSSANDELHKDRCTSHRYYSGGSSEVSHMGGYFSQSHTHSYSQEYSRPLDRTESSLNLEDSSVTAQRLTPTKFSTAHVKASISSGHLVRVLPHYPMDGQSPLVEIMELHELLLANDPEQQELADFPGPLIKGVTHKKTLIEYCENKIKKAESTSNQHIHDKESYILMWELLILLLRQNGVVVGTDIAELLMRSASRQNSNIAAASTNSRRESVVSSISSLPEEMPSTVVDNDDNLNPISSTFKQNNGTNTKGNAFNETYLTNKFREYLIYGSGKEALEWAMKHGLWGHALFLASKLDKRTYANVMMRFANGLTINDPLQTLYQLLSGRQPAAVTCVLDEKWGDWRPHLAMILSNTSQRPELDRKAITTLGDTLQARGSLYAAHFCYLMAQTGFGRFNYKPGRLVLLGSSHQKEFREFATNEAIIMTEIYEYACSLSDTTFTIPEFQPYKYLMATRLAERGFLERALLYTERIGIIISQNPTRYDAVFANQILILAERLCARDPTAMAEFQLDASENADDNSLMNSSWISSLKAVLNDYNMGILQERQSMSNLASSELDITQSLTPPTDHQHDDIVAIQQHQQHQTYDQSSNWVNQQQQQQQHTQQQQQQQHNIDQTQQFYQTDNFLPQQNQQDTISTSTWSDNQYKSQQQQQQSDINNKQQQQTIGYQTTQQDDRRFGNEYQQNQYWDQQQWSADRNINEHDSMLQQQQQQLQDNNYLDNIQQTELPTNNEIKESTISDDDQHHHQQTASHTLPQPQITMPNALGNNRQYDYDEDKKHKTNVEKKPDKSSTAKTSTLNNKQASSSSGWFGGIWNKLSLRPKNQMILPDDKNPTIVWDPEKKKWVNLDADSDETNNEIKPPPKMTDMLNNNKSIGGIPPPSLNNSYQQSNNIQQQSQMQQQTAQMLHNNSINNNQQHQQQQQQSLPPIGVDENDTQFKPPISQNMFKMQRGRGIKKAYVDVFNPGGTTKTTNPTSTLPSLNPTTIPPSNNTQMNFFIPTPVNDPNAPVDFLSPSFGVELHTNNTNNSNHDKT